MLSAARLGPPGTVDMKTLSTFFENETFPADWYRREQPYSLLETVRPLLLPVPVVLNPAFFPLTRCRRISTSSNRPATRSTSWLLTLCRLARYGDVTTVMSTRALSELKPFFRYSAFCTAQQNAGKNNYLPFEPSLDITKYTPHDLVSVPSESLPSLQALVFARTNRSMSPGSVLSTYRVIYALSHLPRIFFLAGLRNLRQHHRRSRSLPPTRPSQRSPGRSRRSPRHALQAIRQHFQLRTAKRLGSKPFSYPNHFC